MEENDSLFCVSVQLCVGVSTLWVNLFFQSPLNCFLGEGQADCVIMTAKQVLRDLLRSRLGVFSKKRTPTISFFARAPKRPR